MQQCAQVVELMMPLKSVEYITLKTRGISNGGFSCVQILNRGTTWLTSHFDQTLFIRQYCKLDLYF